MKQFNFNIENPSTFWENILEYHDVSSPVNQFDLNKKKGSGSYSFKIIDANIQYLQFDIKLNETIKFNFYQTECAKRYKLLLFQKGSSNSVRFLNPKEQENSTDQSILDTSVDKDNSIISCHLLTQFSDIPNFIIKKDEPCTFHLLFLNQDALDEMLPDNTTLNFQYPSYTISKSSEIIGFNKVVCLDKMFTTLNNFHDLCHGNKFYKLGDFLKMLGDYFFVLRALKNSCLQAKSKLHDKDFDKLILIERKLNEAINSSPPSLKDLSEEFGICKTKMCVDFKAFYGKGIHSYYNDLKVNLVKELLMSTSQNMKEISNQLSFSNQSNCNKWFKKNAGTTPKLYRKSRESV
ncbi:helix-turn-helix domain-containing protein [Arcticibacterium luteifluviistationis]|uniref:HTH araC/xylS-type domain-containing protein n=1 Tax=Arcticibacterium luteifluviistationis TaxID=1784714 RepID=A0A2Z4GD97_9BACT|nr:helix-turn-helix transcriptional regulator [Arcticibacterium luteifluviistationis]AWV99292.1 hypothetical protein DJ013_14405 [Arcticibacterium luteifluviistationis]